MLRNFLKKQRVIAAGAVLLFASIATIATNTIGKSPAVNAQSADCNLNIVCNGLIGGSTVEQIDSFKVYYQRGVDNGNKDLDAVYNNWMGATPAIVNGMQANTNTFAGTVYSNGDVKIGSKLVGTNAVVTARFSRAGFTHVEGNVYSRPVTTYEYYATRPALIYMQNGKMLFFVESPCGNAGKATPVIPPTPPTPVASLACTTLALLGGNTDAKGDVTYTLRAGATGNNAVPASYTFNFGQGQGTQVVNSTSTSVTSNPHTYAPGTYNVSATVTGTATNGATVAPTSVVCPASFTIHQPPAGTLQCTAFALNQKGTDATTNNTTATLTATVTPSSPTAFTSYTYQFDFGKTSAGTDQGTQKIVTTSTTATTNVHTYTPGIYSKINVTITGVTPAGQVVSATRTCQTNLTIPSPTCAQNSNQSECTKPTCTAPNGQSYPLGSSECTTTPVVLTSVVTPQKLTNTGPGETIGLFAAVTIGGALVHSYFSRRFAKARG